MPKVVGLTPKQQRFVDEYLIDANATRAAKAAGFSEKGAMRYGSELLTKAEVRKAIAKGLKDQQRRTLVTADGVLKRLDRIARAAEGAGEYAAAIRGNELIGRHYRLFTDQLRVGDPDGKPLAAPQIQPVFNITLTAEGE